MENAARRWVGQCFCSQMNGQTKSHPLNVKAIVWAGEFSWVKVCKVIHVNLMNPWILRSLSSCASRKNAQQSGFNPLLLAYPPNNLSTLRWLKLACASIAVEACCMICVLASWVLAAA